MQQDLYCLSCGYNVRGLDGDPVRCPECGHHNRLRDLLVPAEEIKRSLRRLETGAAMCGAMPAVLLFFLFPLLACIVFGISKPPSHWYLVIILALVLLCVFVWITGVSLFRASCDGKPGWVATVRVAACRSGAR